VKQTGSLFLQKNILNDSPAMNKRFDVLKIQEFRHFVICRFLYIAALRMVFTITGYQVYEIARKIFTPAKAKLMLGFIGLSEVIPAILLALYAGIIVDKSDKRKLILRGHVFYFFCAILFFFTNAGFQNGHLSGQTTIYCIFGIMFCTGLIRAFTGPAHHAIIAQLVPRESLVAAATVSSISWLIAAIAGPVIAGIILATLGTVHAYAAVLVLVAASLFFIRRISPKPVMLKKETRNWNALKEGLRFVLHSKIVLGAMMLDLFAVLFGGAIAMLPVYATDILHTDEKGLGWLNSAEYVGTFITMFLLLMLPMQKKQGVKLLIAVAGFGMATIAFAFSTQFWLSFAALMAVGLFDGVSVVVRSNIMQLYTPDEMRGRVSAVNSMFINSSNEIGQFESGVAASLMGTVPSVAFGGVMTLLVVLVVALRSPVLRKLQY
jgi:MFS family permease